MGIIKKDKQPELTRVDCTNPSAIVSIGNTSTGSNTSGDTMVIVRTDKDARIVRQGVVQAVLQSPALIAYCTDLPSYEKMVKELAEKFVKWVWEE